MNKVSILFFATLRDQAGVKTSMMEIRPGETIAELKDDLVKEFPKLAGLMEHSLVSINHEYHFDESVIPENAEVAFFPPVSGGNS